MRLSVLKFLASCAVIAVVFWGVDGAAVWSHLATLTLGWLLLAIGAVTAATASMARRWQLVARHLGIEISFTSALSEYFLGALINQTLPGGVTGDATRAFRARHVRDLKTAAVSVALERMLGQVAIFGILGIGLVFALIIPGGVAWPAFAWLLPVCVLGTALLWTAMARHTGRVGRFMALGLALQKRPELLLHAVGTSGCLILGFYACARATGSVIPPEGWVTLIPLILMAMLVPLSVGGWGWREGAAAALFPLIGSPASAGVAAGVAYGGVILITTLPVAFLLIQSWPSKHLQPSDRKRIS